MEQIYQDLILAFARAARDVAPLDGATHQASISNPTCGDRVEISLIVEDGYVRATSAAVRGCALCEAGAGLLMHGAHDLPLHDLSSMRDGLAAWLAGDDDAGISDDMAVFAPVRDIRNRHKCVTLAFDAAVKAVSEEDSVG